MNWIVLVGAIILVSFGFVVMRGAPYVPTLRVQLRRAFDELYVLNGKDLVVDLGSGDGVVLAAAQERGARAIGYEINPLLWMLTSFRFWNNKSVTVKLRDYQLLDHLDEDATVVYAFTTSHSIETIGRKLEEWSKHQELYFISYGFMLKSHTPVKTVGPMYLYKFTKQT